MSSLIGSISVTGLVVNRGSEKSLLVREFGSPGVEKSKGQKVGGGVVSGLFGIREQFCEILILIYEVSVYACYLINSGAYGYTGRASEYLVSNT